MELIITKTDKNNINVPITNANDYLVIDNTQTGQVSVKSVSEFSIQHFTIGPGNRDYNLEILMDINPDPNTETLTIIDLITVPSTNNKAYSWIPDLTMSYKNKIYFKITNLTGNNDEIFYFFFSIAPRAQMPFRKF